MKIIVKQYKNIFIIRDDLLPFDSKQRAGIEYLQKLKEKEIIYVFSPNDIRQLALAQCGLEANKKIIIFTPLRNKNHKITKQVENFPNTKVFAKKVNKLSELYKYAEKYNKDTPNSKLLNLGFFDNEFINIMAENINKNWPENIPKKIVKRMWLVSGSGILLNALYKVFPETEFKVVQVGHKIEEDKINKKRTDVITPSQEFEKEAGFIPPYLSSKTYNAKIWQYHKDFTKGDFIWIGAPELNDFPYYRDFTDIEKIYSMFETLKKYDFKNRIEEKDYRVRSINDLTFRFQGKSILLVNKNKDYEDFLEISSYFTETCRMKCAVIGNPSPFNYFINNKDKVYKYTFEKFGIVNIQNLREALYKLNKQCTSFRPNIMMAMIQIFNSKSILDFSSGWGDRLIGAIASNTEYVGIDPNKCLIKGYKEIIQKLGNNHFTKYKMISGKAEEVIIPKRNYDLIFTSPPYYNIEKYTKNKNQSLNNYSEEEQWYNQFLLKVLKKVWDVLIIGGVMAININQKKNDKYVNWMVRDVNKFINAKYLGVISYCKEDYSNPQPIFIWKKLN